MCQKCQKFFKKILCLSIMSEEDKSNRYRRWTFTFNNYTEEDIKVLKYFNHTYIIFGKEVAPTTGTPHLQGYLEIKHGRCWKSLNKVFNGRCYWAVAKGDAAQNYIYDTKDEDYYEHGEPLAMRKGARNDLVQVTKMVQEGCSLREIYSAGLGYQACRHAERILSVSEPCRQESKVQVAWIYGKPGIGKTLIPWDLTVKHLGGIKISNLVFVQGYDRHKYVVVDDLRPTDKCCGSYVNLLHFLDPYAHSVEVKGSSRQLVATHVFITSPLTPEQFSRTYDYSEDEYQLRRRIHKLFHLPNDREALKKYCADIVKDAGQVPHEELSEDFKWLSR